MGKKTLSHAKNDIRSCFMEVVDPSPTKAQINKLWEYFEDQCAYCNKKLARKSREAHIDHLIAKDKGFNHISNRVLACSHCNGDQKRETAKTRILKIDMWIELNGRPPKDNLQTAELRKIAKRLSDKICEALEAEVDLLRKQRDQK